MNTDISEHKKSVLRERARILAQETGEDGTVDRDSIEIIQFRMANEIYGVESAFVQEVYPLQDFTTLPGVPPFVLGIVNVRGRILSVVDLKKFFNLPERGLGNLNKVIILHDDNMEFGILADVILYVDQVPLDDIQTLPMNISEIGAKYLKGVTAERVIIIDAEKILGDERITVNEEVV